MMNVTLKNVKTFPSREWGDKGGFSFTIHQDKTKLAEVFEAGDGGPIDVKLLTPEALNILSTIAKNKLDIDSLNLCKTESDLVDMVVFTLLGEYETDKKMLKMSKKATVFRLKEDTAEEYRVYKQVGPNAIEALKKHYGDKLVWIYGHTL